MKQYVDENQFDFNALQLLLTPPRLKNTDLNTLMYNNRSQLYFAGGDNGCTNVPEADKTSGFCLIVLRCAEGWCTQIFISHLNRAYVRTGPLDSSYLEDGKHEWRDWKLLTS